MYELYLQSFLKWIWLNNHQFASIFDTEEIVTYFLNEFNHPDWFEYSFKKDMYKIIPKISRYFENHKNDASMYRMNALVQPKTFETVPYMEEEVQLASIMEQKQIIALKKYTKDDVCTFSKEQAKIILKKTLK